MLYDIMREKMVSAMKSGDVICRDIMRLIISEVSRNDKKTDDEVNRVVKKVIEGNNETLKFGNNDRLVKENEILINLLPKRMSKEEVLDKLGVVINDIKLARTEGVGMGIAMKVLKGMEIEGSEVLEIVKEIRL